MSNNLSETMDALMQNQGPIKEVKIRKYLLNRFIVRIEFQENEETKEITHKKQKIEKKQTIK